ncbi:hypothetical protein [Cytobacillus sp. IB215316]|uniref:hypothetical protein n=1 Tax=Cytobacillus sp. IB215316 TaxID=3097354 RepID=UPI002A0EC722|nr:hypothetical protein [Cytobacillus sp. IB215316]MDX8361302.1 hypothetical protein [Cytobacillus sp. IB215316]
MKKIGLLALAGAITLGGVSATSAFAKYDSNVKYFNKDHFQEKWNELSDEEKMAKLTERAEQLGIDVEGKTLEEIQDLLKEQREQKLLERAEELGIDTEGKTVDEVIELVKEQAPHHKGKRMNKEKFQEKWNELSDEEKMAKLTERAEQLGIDVEGKTLEEIQDLLKEQREQKLLERAEELGIDTEGKTVDEVIELVKEQAPHHKGKRINKEKFQEKWNELSDEEKMTKLTERADQLGIDVEGKSLEEIQDLLKEQREQKLFERAEELGIDTEGKTVDEVIELMKEQAPSHKGKRMNKEKFQEKWNELSDEEKEAKLLEKAEQLGIDVEGKSLEEIQELLKDQRQQRLIQRAEELGIDTEGKTVEEIKELLKEARQSSEN